VHIITMKALESKSCDEQRTNPTNLLSNDTTSIQSPLLRLPLELRRIIYGRSIACSRSPSPQEVHENNLRAIWEDLPSPLLCVNKQVRSEVIDLLQKAGFTVRVTCHGANFDALGLSCFIAQQRPKSYGDLPVLRVEIWPPHPDRPVEMFYIWDHLRKLRDDLRAVARIPKLVVWFKENDIATWCQDGAPRYILTPSGEVDPLWCDIVQLLDHFACITNVTKAHMRLPPSLTRNEQNDGLRERALCVMETMEGEGTLADEESYILSLESPERHLEDYLKLQTAQIARNKLNTITYNGRYKMSEAKYHNFIKVWPHFETLTEFDEGGAYEGEWYYRAWPMTMPDVAELEGFTI
jgi:hypothetical protein